MLTELHKVLMERDDLSAHEAEEEINEMRERVLEGEDPEEVLFDEGLEPDYVYDLMETF